MDIKALDHNIAPISGTNLTAVYWPIANTSCHQLLFSLW